MVEDDKDIQMLVNMIDVDGMMDNRHAFPLAVKGEKNYDTILSIFS